MLPLTVEERAMLEARLAEAEKAQHDVMIGGSVRTVVDQNGERIEFSPANAQRLAAYITLLKVKLGKAGVGGLDVWMA